MTDTVRWTDPTGRRTSPRPVPAPTEQPGPPALAELPLFAAPLPGTTAGSPRPGRVRSTFALPADAAGPAQPRLPERGPVTALPSWAVPPPPGERAAMAPAEVDWSVVAVLRAQASDRLSAALGEDRARLDRPAQQELGRAIILELLQAEAAERLSAGAAAWPPPVQDRLADAVFHALFGLGRLQPLVDDDRVENIIITGHDRVWLELTDGRTVPGESVADSDQELVDFLVFLASRSEVNARPFSPAVPRLHLRLDGGARLAASAWVTPRPSIVIRRHRLQQVTLPDLARRGTLSPVAASFLAAAVRARLSIVVAGPQGAGKTTMVRAMCAEIPPWEAIGTFETEYELHLHEMPDLHPIVHPWEARPGSGERGPDGRQAGEFTLDEALYDSFRFNLSRQIVGEVRGREILAMIKAMESGAGSISTTHARHGEAALRKLVTCAMEAGAHVTYDYATRAVAENIDLVVQLHLDTEPTGGGGFRRHRWLAEILAVAPGERDRGYATTHVFRPAVGGPAVAGVLPDEYRDLAEFGFDLPAFYAEAAGADR